MGDITITLERYNELIRKEMAYEMLKKSKEDYYWTDYEKGVHATLDQFAAPVESGVE